MNKVYFDDNKDLAAMMYDHVLDDEAVALIADAETCGEIIADLFKHDAIMDGDILGAEYITIGYDYDIPYIVSLDEEGGVWCEPALRKGDDRGIIGFDDDIVFVQSKYLSDALDACYNEDTLFVEIVEDEEDLVPDKFHEEDEGDEGFEFIKDADDKLCGFTYNAEGDGYCFHVRVCSCGEKSLDTVVDSYNQLVGSLVHFMVNK